MCHTSHGSLLPFNICSFMACLALLEILIPSAHRLDSAPSLLAQLGTEWFPLLYVTSCPWVCVFCQLLPCWSQLAFMRKTSLLKSRQRALHPQHRMTLAQTMDAVPTVTALQIRNQLGLCRTGWCCTSPCWLGEKIGWVWCKH